MLQSDAIFHQMISLSLNTTTRKSMLNHSADEEWVNNDPKVNCSGRGQIEIAVNQFINRSIKNEYLK